ncbi:glycosyltransferase N-terminal domain-containing protein [Croceitalea sp. MTPC9]|uniref:3-deoxy-D-manno-octulosonic acid transferase n=1 Tax=unclassified Croceitalea TaxID=2632280 RepID=UPI002B3AC1F7|nr:glycosyltransferase N-terminal domain-containing protein [Croceitalea sp. MTPC6]GMN17583.1 glycosyltransferase N-terminal domain-containing protein [Croceitalea sp. MTPC9]
MHALYSFLVHVAWFVLKQIAHFKPKIKLFVDGRKSVFPILENSITSTDKIIWMHVASLGEYEQGLPILQQLKALYPDYKILLTFFSPSGYEVKKNSDVADIITYLPLDTVTNAERFLEITNPKMALFVKYEIWPNYLKELCRRKIPALLVSALFSKKQVYFKWYGQFMRRSLSVFKHFFVQDENSRKLLNSIGLNNVSVSGDTRFDRVLEILERDNRLDFMDNFKQDNFCFVVGSSWAEDEEVIVDFINTSDKEIKYVIAPHNIKGEHIKKLKNSITKKVVCYSQLKNKPLNNYEVLLVDTIGLLTKIYSYADIAYVGGGFKTGLHNTLEPAVFGIPILIGPNYHGFKEAEELVKKGGVLSIKTKEEFSTTLNNLLENDTLPLSTGKTNSQYISSNKGTTSKIISYIHKVL